MFSDEKPIIGLIQIYSVDNQLSQCIEGQAVTFIRYQFSSSSAESSVLVVAKRVSFNCTKLFINRLGPEAYFSHTTSLNNSLFYSSSQMDYPFQIICSIKLGLIYIVTKFGYLNVCDLKTGCSLIRNYHMINDCILKANLDHQTETPLIITCKGTILTLRFKFNKFLEHIQNLSKKSIYKRISRYLLSVDKQVTKL